MTVQSSFRQKKNCKYEEIKIINLRKILSADRMSEYYGILDELSRETPSPEVVEHIARSSDTESEADEIPPPLEPCSEVSHIFLNDIRE